MYNICILACTSLRDRKINWNWNWKKEVKCLEVRPLLFFCVFFSTPFKNSSQGPAAVTGICSFASYKRKEKKNVCCVWNSSWLLGGVLTGSWLLLTFRDDFLLVLEWFLFFPKNRQVYSRIIKRQTRRHQEAAETPPRIARHVKKCHEVSKRRRSVKNIFENFKKCLGPSRSIKNTEEVLRSYQEVSKKSLRMIKNSSSAGFLFKIRTVGQLLDGQPEFNRIINKN